MLEDTVRAFRGSNSHSHVLAQSQLQRPVILFRLIAQELVAVGLRESEDSSQVGNVQSDAVDCLAQEILSVLADAPLPDFDIAVNFGMRPLLQRRPDHVPDRMQRHRQENDDVIPLFSLCSSSDFLDMPLPVSCPQVICGDLVPQRVSRGSREEHAMSRTGRQNGSLLHTEANLRSLLMSWKPSKHLEEQRQVVKSSAFAVRCYLFRMLASYGELLRYAPGHVQTSLFSRSERLHLRTFSLPQPRHRRLSSRDFESACAELIDDAAQ